MSLSTPRGTGGNPSMNNFFILLDFSFLLFIKRPASTFGRHEIAGQIYNHIQNINATFLI